MNISLSAFSRLRIWSREECFYDDDDSPPCQRRLVSKPIPPRFFPLILIFFAGPTCSSCGCYCECKSFMHLFFNLAACETESAVVPSRVSLLISILRLNLVLTYGIAPEFRGGVYLFIKTSMLCNRVSPEFIGSSRNIASRWRSLARVRQHRASEPQGSCSERVLP